MPARARGSGELLDFEPYAARLRRTLGSRGADAPVVARFLRPGAAELHPLAEPGGDRGCDSAPLHLPGTGTRRFSLRGELELDPVSGETRRDLEPGFDILDLGAPGHTQRPRLPGEDECAAAFEHLQPLIDALARRAPGLFRGHGDAPTRASDDGSPAERAA